MVRTNAQELVYFKSRKIAQAAPTSEQLKDTSAVLLDVLKVLEPELQKRGILKIPPGGGFHPVWFLAETERNIFLWRTGCSLIEQDEFEFWIDVRGLVEKRLKSIETADEENPFKNPLWGSSQGQSTELRADETRYLESFLDILASIEAHATALCLVAHSVLEELCPEAKLRHSVLLPTKKRRPAQES